jgi:hypothetical protein
VGRRLLGDGSGWRGCDSIASRDNWSFEIWKLGERFPKRSEILLPVLAAAEVLVDQAPEGL